MSYGFDKSPVEPVQLPKSTREASIERPALTSVLQAGTELGFVSRDTATRRRPGPRRTEVQDKITVTGPKRIIDRLKAYSDGLGGASYCEAIDALLNAVEAKGK